MAAPLPQVVFHGLSAKIAESRDEKRIAAHVETDVALQSERQPLNRTLLQWAVVFLLSYLVLLLGMSRRPNPYDEGLVLTAAMRVASGQIPHRDFYANYGPGQFYVLAGLFRVFGESLLVERLFDAFIKALLVASLFAVTLSYCRKRVAGVTALVALLWLVCANSVIGTPVIPVALLNLVGLTLILPVFQQNASTRRMLAAGAIAGMAALFRYDTGIALFAIQACVVGFAIYLKDTPRSLHSFLSNFWPCLVGFAAVTLPFAFYYLSVAPLHPIVYDIFLYPGKYYHRGRNLPFPRVSRVSLELLEVYLPLAAIGISFYIVIRQRTSAGNDRALRLLGFLLTFALLALAMYFKGYVRIMIDQMLLCIIPTLLLTAVLFEHRSSFRPLSRAGVVVLAGLSLLAVSSATFHRVKELHLTHISVVEWILTPAGKVSPEHREWCATRNPLTRGFCFLPDDDRIRVIDFIDSHTAPDQRLYLGLTNHSRIFVNDNITYFATQRLPATMWSHFDPGLQNSYDTQIEMARELNLTAPPYIVLDSEYDAVREPNESSRSTGVTLLDDYIRNNYRPVEHFARMTIWQRVE
jgi:Dolichyl-phosphate-mannose-protein mannosyltransferase